MPPVGGCRQQTWVSLKGDMNTNPEDPTDKLITALDTMPQNTIARRACEWWQWRRIAIYVTSAELGTHAIFLSDL